MAMTLVSQPRTSSLFLLLPRILNDAQARANRFFARPTSANAQESPFPPAVSPLPRRSLAACGNYLKPTTRWASGWLLIREFGGTLSRFFPLGCGSWECGCISFATTSLEESGLADGLS
ncbi:hypothetical protein V8C26DRAFT_385002 [Trichoderma gracile]